MNALADEVIEHLGVDPAPPGRELLARVHRAFVCGVTYDTVGIHLGAPPPLDTEQAARRVLTGRVGYCFGMNGALWWLLRQLGFDVELRAAVVRRPGDTSDPGVNHVTLLVRLVEGDMLADAGMGDGLLEPLPLVEGEYRQEPYTFALRRFGSRWAFLHDRAGSFSRMDIGDEPIDVSDLERPHAHLTTSPESGFVQALVLLRRRETSIDILRSRTLYRTTAEARIKRLLTDAAELRDVLEQVFETPVTDAELELLWRRATEQHEAFLAARR